MRYPVIRRFQCKNTGVVYRAGSAYETDDPVRVKELAGLIGAPIEDADTVEDPSVLDKSVPDLIIALTDIEDGEELERLLEMERAGKTRKTAINAIEVRLAELEG